MASFIDIVAGRLARKQAVSAYVPGSTADSIVATDLTGMVASRLVGAGRRCKAFNNSDQTISNAVVTSVLLNSENYDTDNLHDPSTNNSRLTAPMSGYYLFGANLTWEYNNTGVRYIAVVQGGSTTIASVRQLAAEYSEQSLMGVTQLGQGGYIELKCYQTSGVNLKVLNGTSWNTNFWIEKFS